MSKKWTCNTKCYVPVGGILKLRLPGDDAEGEIDVIYQKYFELIGESGEPPEIKKEATPAPKSNLSNKEMRSLLKKEGVKFFPGASRDKLIELVANLGSQD
jgi:hypothetical protein